MAVPVGHVLLQAVLECDVERHELLAEEKQLMALLNKVWVIQTQSSCAHEGKNTAATVTNIRLCINCSVKQWPEKHGGQHAAWTLACVCMHCNRTAVLPHAFCLILLLAGQTGGSSQQCHQWCG